MGKPEHMGCGRAVAISRKMTSDVVAACLINHGCINITDQLSCTTSFAAAPHRSGGFGDVYSAILKNGCRAAVKFAKVRNTLEARSKSTKRTARELYMTLKCKHENILNSIGFAYLKDRIALVFPWMENGTLLEYVTQCPTVDRYQLGAQVAQGVFQLHKMDMIHGDIKGANVMISYGGVAKLSDFGNASSTRNSLLFTTTTGEAQFSTRWAAPELFEPTGTYSKASDVYALGMTILEAITGSVPFAHIERELAVMAAVSLRKEIPHRPDSIPTGYISEDLLWELLTHCWAYETSGRPTALHVVETLQVIQTERSSPLAGASV